MSTATLPEPAIEYPESDGKPMADNTLQWDWMVMIVTELRLLFGQTHFVAGNLFWYPVQGRPDIVRAPDGLVAFGRPPGYRGSYKQWEEENVTPQVVFEILSPSNDDDDIDAMLDFYGEHGVEEYYFIDPYANTVLAYHRRKGSLRSVPRPYETVSPRLGIRFQQIDGVLAVIGPDGRRFEKPEIVSEELRRQLAASYEEVEAARSKAEKLAAKLRELGVDPDSI